MSIIEGYVAKSKNDISLILGGGGTEFKPYERARPIETEPNRFIKIGGYTMATPILTYKVPQFEQQH